MAPQEKRRCERYPTTHHMYLKTSTGVTRSYVTLDVSNGGMFVLAAISDQWPVGMEVIITQVLPVSEESTLTLRGRVVRRNKLGMGIEFLDLKLGDDAVE